MTKYIVYRSGRYIQGVEVEANSKKEARQKTTDAGIEGYLDMQHFPNKSTNFEVEEISLKRDDTGEQK